MRDIQTTKTAETARVQQKVEQRPPPERENAPPASVDATLFRSAASDDPTTPPQHLARVLRRLAAPHQKTGFLLQCQRRYGNAYVRRMVSCLDKEQPSVLKKESDGAEPIQTKSAGALSDSFEAGADVETQLSLSKGRGSPLPDTVRDFMEPRFGADFSAVRVHTGSDALQMNQAVGAQAFSHGSDIYFGAGSNPTNLELTAHELTHVIQQKGSPPLQTKKREEEVAPPGPESSIQRICAACTADDRKEKGFDPIDTQDVNAHAYTVGHNMVFGAGRLAPGTHEGRRLVAHELTHVVQESGADGTSVGQSNENRGLSPIPPTLHTQQNATRQTKLMVSTPGAPQLSPNAQAPAAPAGPGVAPGMATPGARPVDPPEVLNQLKTEAKADALKIKQLLHSNLKDVPMWEMGKLMLEGKKAAWDIIAKWGAKPREAGYQGRGGYMTPFDFFVAALQTQTFTVSEWGVDQWTNAFELICERLSGANVAIFKTWVQTQGKLFKDEKPRGMVHFDVGQVLVEAGEVYLELGGAFLTGGSSLVAKIVKWLAVDLPKLMNQAKSVIDFVEKIRRDVNFDDVKKFLSPTGIGQLLGSALFGRAGALPTVGEAQDEKKETEAGAPSEAGGLIALLRKVLTVVGVVKRSYSKVAEAVNAGLAKLDITKQGKWFETFSMVYAGIVHAVKTVKNPGAALGKASETLRGIVGGFFQTIKEKIGEIASGVNTGLDLAGRGKKLIANLADKAVEMVVNFLIKHNPSAAIKAALRVLETAADQPIVQLLRNKVPYGDEIFKKISESSIVRGLLSPLERPIAAVSEMTETAAGEATAVVTKVEQEALALVGDGATMVSELAGVPVPQGDASAPAADVAGASGKAAGGGKASPGFLGALKQGIHAGLLELGTLNLIRHGKQLGKAVVQVGLPKDPSERLNLGLDAAVRAVNALRGRVVTAAMIKPVLSVIKARYGFKTLEPVEIDGDWWVEGEVNPRKRKKTQVSSEIDKLLREGAPEHPISVEEMDKATTAIKKGAITPKQLEIIIKKIVNDARLYLKATQQEKDQGKPLSWERVYNRCAAGRDVSAAALATIATESKQQIILHRFQSQQVFEVNKHGFNVITLLPGKKSSVRYLVDPTFAQFMRPEGEPPVERYSKIGTADVLRTDPAGMEFAKDLIEKGYIRLTDEKMRLYAWALGVAKKKAASLGARLKTGKYAFIEEVFGGKSGSAPIVKVEEQEEIGEIELNKNYVIEEPQIMDLSEVHDFLMNGIAMVIDVGDPLKILPKLNELRKRLDALIKKTSVK